MNEYTLHVSCMLQIGFIAVKLWKLQVLLSVMLVVMRFKH